ncbi:hypothetical protein WN944_026761 [Citrus x changshan-huyou]|uniref:Integrase catalytic domain-containing protein n=1 Tax=Citrus x changshan-huyou TaxID=2935761 RepID=A0AAP0LG90_9ROSI
MEWIIDTGAYHHMTGSLKSMSDVMKVLSCPVGLPNGKEAIAKKEGTIDHNSRMLIGTGEQREGLYYFWSIASVRVMKTVGKDTVDLWHQRLGHPSDKVIKLLPIVNENSNNCTDGLRSDNGTKFTCLDDYFMEKGRIHQTSCVGTPQQNRGVEHKHRHILDVVRALRFQANLPIEFWREYILTAAYLINRTLFDLLRGKAPYEILFGQTPSYKNIRVFGFLAYAHNQRCGGDKFANRRMKYVFVGYLYRKKGWNLYDMDSGEFFVSKDVVFMENEFPYLNKGTSEHDKTRTNEFDGLVAKEEMMWGAGVHGHGAPF